MHALLGENGAGKSTLMSVLYGLYKPDAGEILLDGKPLQDRLAPRAIAAGIGMVHQHFTLIPVMTVAENIVLGMEPTHGPFIDRSEAEKRVRAIAVALGFRIDPHDRVESISVGQQQRVEILKALYRNAEILILDEPTAVLTPQEANELFEIIRTLTREGQSVIFISHKLHEVLAIADRITVLRAGEAIDTVPRARRDGGAAGADDGRPRGRAARRQKGASQPGEPLLVVENLTVLDERELEAVRDVSLNVRAGEIVGIAGVDGNGQTELIDALTGLRRPSGGRILLRGKDVTGAHARTVLDEGVGHIPEDRQRRGLVLDFTLAENLALHDFKQEPASRFGWLYPKRLVERAVGLLREFDVRGGGPATLAASLSGGQPAEGRRRARGVA